METSGIGSSVFLTTALGKTDGKAESGSNSAIRLATTEEALASVSTQGKADGKVDGKAGGIGSIVDVSA